MASETTNRRGRGGASAREGRTGTDSREGKNSRARVLETTLTQINRQFGKGAVMLLGESSADMSVQAISTGALPLDIALGIGGIPRGRITEIYGPESSGKTTLALSTVAEAQKAGGTAAFIDVEHALDPAYAKVLGVNVDELLVSQPSTGEEALEIADILIKSGAIDIIVVDSVAALVPRAELDGEMGDSHVGLQARLMSQAMRKLTGSLSRSRCAAIFINQIRMKIGVMFGNPETTSGGRALKFYSSVRLDIRRIGNVDGGGEIIGSRAKVKVAKNKVAPPFKICEFDILYGLGINREGCVLDLAVENRIVDKSGSWYSYGPTKIGQGRENVCKFLRENADILEEVEALVRSKLMGTPPPEETAGEDKTPVN